MKVVKGDQVTIRAKVVSNEVVGVVEVLVEGTNRNHESRKQIAIFTDTIETIIVPPIKVGDWVKVKGSPTVYTVIAQTETHVWAKSGLLHYTFPLTDLIKFLD